MKGQLVHTYNDIISLENLLCAWQEFIAGKKLKMDVQTFSRHLMDNILELHTDLVNRTYRHGGYESFYINDPKRRHIHKANVRDRLLHHAVYRVLYPFFDKTFIAHSYSCRNNKGVHKAALAFRAMVYQVSRNHRRTAWVLKCDIKQFFASINHATLLAILREYIPDRDILGLLENIVSSYQTKGLVGVGLPLGNLTSQLLANVYLNVLDVWAKHTLKAKQYIRYADDFVFLSPDKQWLEAAILKIQDFLQIRLQLSLHPNKIALQTVASGVDFLGWVHFPDHRVLRMRTKQRMSKKIEEKIVQYNTEELSGYHVSQSVQSYLGMIQHGNGHKISGELKSRLFFETDIFTSFQNE